jgi:hypothetical protein
MITRDDYGNGNEATSSESCSALPDLDINLSSERSGTAQRRQVLDVLNGDISDKRDEFWI